MRYTHGVRAHAPSVVAVVLAGSALSTAFAGAAWAPCTSFVVAHANASPNTNASADASTRLVATAGRRRARYSFAGHSFEQQLGPFTMSCETTNDGHYWDYDHCTLIERRACEAEELPMGGGAYGFQAETAKLFRAADGSYLVSSAPGHVEMQVRSDPAGRRWTRKLATSLALLGLLLAGVSVSLRRRARATMAAKEAWLEGLIDENSWVVPLGGGARHPVLTRFTREISAGDSVLFPPVDPPLGYRDAPEPVPIVRGTFDDLARRSQSTRRVAALLLAASMIISAAAASVGSSIGG